MSNEFLDYPTLWNSTATRRFGWLFVFRSLRRSAGEPKHTHTDGALEANRG